MASVEENWHDTSGDSDIAIIGIGLGLGLGPGNAILPFFSLLSYKCGKHLCLRWFGSLL